MLDRADHTVSFSVYIKLSVSCIIRE